MLKFMWNGLKLDNKLFTAWYSLGSYTDSKTYPQGTITIYAREYSDFPKIEELQIRNDSDSMTDYFEKDKIDVKPNNKFYKEVHEAYLKQEAHRQKAHDKRMSA